MRWNVSLKRKLSSTVGDEIELTTEEVIELLDAICHMLHKVKGGGAVVDDVADEVINTEERVLVDTDKIGVDEKCA